MPSGPHRQDLGVPALASRAELVGDAILHSLPVRLEVPDTGDLRQDLLILLRHTARFLDGPTGNAIRGLMGGALRDGALPMIARVDILDAAQPRTCRR